MRFKDFLQERAKIQYMAELISMAPPTMEIMIKKILMLEFDEEPPY